MKNNYKLFTSIWFLLGILLLLTNDFLFKESYGNWLTGKLSDVAGLFIFSVFWVVFFPKNKVKIFFLTAILFIFWKSPYSQPFIDTWNTFGMLKISRVVDYTDLLALPVLPLGYYVFKHKNRLKSIKINPIIPSLLAVFSFMATSYSTEIKINKSYQFDLSKEVLKEQLKQIKDINFEQKSKSSNTQPETIQLRFQHEICSDPLELKAIIKDSSDSTSVMTLIKASHFCQKNEDDKQQVIDAFEKRVIQKIKL